jgi:hypothetical protein
LRSADDLCGLGPPKLAEASEPLGLQPDAVKNSNLAMDTLKVVFTPTRRGQGVFVFPIFKERQISKDSLLGCLVGFNTFISIFEDDIFFIKHFAFYNTGHVHVVGDFCKQKYPAN